MPRNTKWQKVFFLSGTITGPKLPNFIKWPVKELPSLYPFIQNMIAVEQNKHQ